MCSPHYLYIGRKLTFRKYIRATRIAGKIWNEYNHTFHERFDQSERFHVTSTFHFSYTLLVHVSTKVLFTQGVTPRKTGCAARFLKPLTYLRLEQKFDTLFMAVPADTVALNIIMKGFC